MDKLTTKVQWYDIKLPWGCSSTLGYWFVGWWHQAITGISVTILLQMSRSPIFNPTNHDTRGAIVKKLLFSYMASDWLATVITVTTLWVWWRLKSPASRLFSQSFIQVQIKETLKLRVTGLCDGNSPVTGELPSQRSSNAENVSIWWRHHGFQAIKGLVKTVVH